MRVKPLLLDSVPFSTAYYDRADHLLRLTLAPDDKYRLYTPLNKISPDLITATLTQEDRHFYTHSGVRIQSLLRGAFQTYIRRSRSVGGSTISMQVVRLRDNLNTRNPYGKVLQIVRAWQLERHYTKPQILEAYLNLAPYGGNIHGAGAASLIYFGQSANALAMPESLALAVIPQNPVRRSPLNQDPAAWREARQRLFRQLPPTYAIYARQMSLPLTVRSPAQLPFLAPHFVDGLSPAAPGKVVTTLDLSKQRLLESHITSWLERERTKGIDNAAAMLVDTGTMEVRALVGSADFFKTDIGGQNDGTAARRSPGSTLKPFIYALAMDQGLIHPETLLVDDPRSFAEYRPVNFDKGYLGTITAHDALVLSRNLPAIALSARLKPDLYQFLQNAGADMPKSRENYGLSIAVGGAEIDMRTLARLYAMMANGGTLKSLHYIAGERPGPTRQMLSPEAALVTIQMLGRPAPDSVPFASESSTLPVYWKTGTSSGFRDAWTAGLFGPYALVVWTGHFDGRGNPAFIGADAAAPLFFDIARALSAQNDLSDKIMPALARAKVSKVALCSTTGLPGACAVSREDWFIPGKSPFAAKPFVKLGPEILSPRGGVVYVNSSASAEPLHIPLQAGNTAGRTPLYWFDDSRFIGMTADETPLFWTPRPGRHVIHLVDANGHAALQTIDVMMAQ